MADVADDHDALVAWLADRHVHCPLCGYGLCGLGSPQCPECGQALRLGVELADPYLKAWVALLIALLPPAGLGLLWAVLIPILGMPRRGEQVILAPIAYQVAAIPLSIVALRGRRRFQRLPRPRQRRLAALAAAATILTFIVLFWTMAR